jgi:hypothetical protein
MVMTSNPAVGREGRRYLRKPVPLFFPTDEEVPEHKLHVLLRTALFELVRLGLGDRVMVGTEQFVYYDASDPRRCLAPDLMVWVGAPDEIFGTWKVWERGAPHVAVEIVSPADKPPGPWHKKLERYVQCGIQEVVRFDPVAKDGQLRIWDRVEGDLVERDLSSPSGYLCDALGLYWCLIDDPKCGLMLRLARDSAGRELLPTPVEAQEQAEARAHQAEVQAREAEQRIRELEAQLAKRG